MDCLVIVIAFLLLFSGGLVSAVSPPEKGDVLPEMALPVPEDSAYKAYLGLQGEGVFQIPQIKARVVLVEIFSMYCPACQREAPRVNELYKIIESDPKMRKEVKLIGIGAGNTPFEVNIFKKKYQVSFPLFSDQDFSVHKSLGEVRTPFFIGVKINPDGTHEIFYTLLGGFEKPDEFLKLLLKLSG
jgi:peroxiredoxin